MREALLWLNDDYMAELELTAEPADEHMRALLLTDTGEMLRKAEECGVTLGTLVQSQMTAWYVQGLARHNSC